ncbi:MAG: aspartate aminotransferase family protein [Alphaproteobacteria bacterium]|nr:aspartate aminotransferase family protein [Alphaproteobacteria bacterium]
MTTDAQNIIDETFKHLIKTYEPQPVVMDHGEGIYAFDTDGKKYFDFAAGIAVASLGHAHPVVLETINKQAARLMAVQNSYATKEKLAAAKLIVAHSCIDLVYFSNSGTESVEAALKCARKWAHDEKGPQAIEIIAFRNSFHGRTYGSASVTEKFHTQPFFGPYIPGIQWAEFNNLESVRALISKDKTAAVIVEPVQGEGGLAVAEVSFLQGLRDLCTQNNVCLIFDEVQAGFGRLGYLHAYEAFTDAHGTIVEPDIICWAKGMGSGFPVGAMGAKEKFGKAIVVGTHGTTYGGNPLACAVAHTVITTMLKPGFLENVRASAKAFHDGLSEIQRRSNKITAIKGKGLMSGIETTIEIKTLMRALQKNGLMSTQAGKATIRLTPPLIITPAQIHQALQVIERTVAEA